MPTDIEMRCSFCGKARNQVNKLIQGAGGIFICDECVSACNDILDEAEGKAQEEKPVEDKLLK